MIVDCIGCTHGSLPKLSGGDLLIITGDLTAKDTLTEYSDFLEWLNTQDYKKKVVVAGNHDNFLQNNPNFYSKTNIDYLCDSGTEFEGCKIWGSPWTRTFPEMNPNCKAFTLDTEKELLEKWILIPDGTDILITHSPSFGNFDYTTSGESVGSICLWFCILDIKPKLHVFSHIHEAYGNCVHANGIILVNCSIMNERYKSVNKPFRIVL
jgi:Icc-related predicted phosphoesterase